MLALDATYVFWLMYFCLHYFHFRVTCLNIMLNLFYYLFCFLLGLHLQFHYVLLAKKFVYPSVIPLQPCICNSIRICNSRSFQILFLQKCILKLIQHSIQYFLTWLFESCSVKFEVNESHCTWVYLYLNFSKMCLLK